MTDAESVKIYLRDGREGCCLVGSVLDLDRNDETGQLCAGLVTAASAPDELWRHSAPPSSPMSTASVVKTTLMADDTQAQNTSFRSSFVQRLVDSGRRHQKFQRLPTSDSRRYLCKRVPVNSLVGRSVDGDTGKATSSTSAAGDRERLATNVHANTGADHGHCWFLDDAKFEPKLCRLLSAIARHCTKTVQSTW